MSHLALVNPALHFAWVQATLTAPTKPQRGVTTAQKTQSTWGRLCAWFSNFRAPTSTMSKSQQANMSASYQALLEKRKIENQKKRKIENQTPRDNIGERTLKGKGLTSSQLREVEREESLASKKYQIRQHARKSLDLASGDLGSLDSLLFGNRKEELEKEKLAYRITHNTALIEPNSKMVINIGGVDYHLPVHIQPQDLNMRVNYCHPLTGRIVSMIISD